VGPGAFSGPHGSTEIASSASSSATATVDSRQEVKSKKIKKVKKSLDGFAQENLI
jgi:hypothetical protein